MPGSPPSPSSLRCTLLAGCTHGRANTKCYILSIKSYILNIKSYILNIKCKKAAAFLRKGRQSGLRAGVLHQAGGDVEEPFPPRIPKGPQRPGDRGTRPLAPPHPFRGQNRSWGRAAPAENPRRWTRVGLGGSGQSIPPRVSPHVPAPSRRNSSSWPLAGWGSPSGASTAGAGGSPVRGLPGGCPSQTKAGFPRRETSPFGRDLYPGLNARPHRRI